MRTTMDDFFDGKIAIKKMEEQQEVRASHKISASMPDICTQFAAILQCKVIDSTSTSCTVMKTRNIPVKIMDKQSKSEITLAATFSFEDLDSDYVALNLGETIILQEEISEFIFTLENNGIIVSALHTHWIFCEPHIMYVNFQSIDNPLIFAAKAVRAMNTLK